jgi:hypothetical protein
MNQFKNRICIATPWEKFLMKKAKPVQPTLAPALGGSDKTPHKVWTGMLTFGLISMPVCLMTAAAEEKISFNQLHEKCKGRIKQQLHCPACEEVVPKTGLLKGFEFEKGNI